MHQHQINKNIYLCVSNQSPNKKHTDILVQQANTGHIFGKDELLYGTPNMHIMP